MRAIARTPLDWANLRRDPSTRKAAIGRIEDLQTIILSGETRGDWVRLAEPDGWVSLTAAVPIPLLEIVPDMTICDGLDSPIGTEDERRTSRVWPGFWVDANPYGTLNYLTHSDGTFVLRPDGSKIPKSYHTGSDLNLNEPHWDSDKGLPLYAAADGQVITCAKFDVWDDVIVIQHDPLPNGLVVYTRYAHMDAVAVHTWQKVKRGDVLGTIGNAAGTMAYHLHFDVCLTDVLVQKPQHWPKLNKRELKVHYVDPKKFIQTHHYSKYTGG